MEIPTLFQVMENLSNELPTINDIEGGGNLPGIYSEIMERDASVDANTKNQYLDDYQTSGGEVGNNINLASNDQLDPPEVSGKVRGMEMMEQQISTKLPKNERVRKVAEMPNDTEVKEGQREQLQRQQSHDSPPLMCEDVTILRKILRQVFLKLFQILGIC